MNKLTRVFKILSDETRLRIVILLAQQELCVCQISGILDVAQPKVSKNLAKLRDTNLVVDERKEKFVFYSLKKENEVLMNIVNNILGNLDEFPQLSKDQSGIADKEIYLSQCGIEDN